MGQEGGLTLPSTAHLAFVTSLDYNSYYLESAY